MKPVVTFSAVLLGCSTLLTGAQAHAWGDLGHSIVGAVAEETMAPQTKDYLRGLMGVEPLEVSAVFPDHVRDDNRFGHKESDVTKRAGDIHDFGDYHFCEIPTGQTYDTRIVKPAKDCYGAIEGSIAVLKNASASREEKQLALRYLAHVMGDITQPLHVGNGFDQGANVCLVQVQETPGRNPFTTNFHSFWDDTIVTYLGSTYAVADPDPMKSLPGAKYLSQYMTALHRVRPEMLTAQSKAQFAKGSVKDWLQEAQAVRESGLYPDAEGSIAGVKKGEEYKNRPYCSWFTDQVAGIKAPNSEIDKSKLPVLDQAYEQKWSKVAEDQLLKGGLRLAAVLDDVATSQPNAPKMNDALQEKTLQDLQNAFHAGNGLTQLVPKCKH